MFQFKQITTYQFTPLHSICTLLLYSTVILHSTPTWCKACWRWSLSLAFYVYSSAAACFTNKIAFMLLVTAYNPVFHWFVPTLNWRKPLEARFSEVTYIDLFEGLITVDKNILLSVFSLKDHVKHMYFSNVSHRTFDGKNNTPLRSTRLVKILLSWSQRLTQFLTLKLLGSPINTSWRTKFCENMFLLNT